MTNKQIKEQIDYWKISAEHNWKTAQGLFSLKHYDACLFFCHLTLEKILKGLVVEQTKQTAPFIHDLEKLAILSAINFSEEQLKDLKVITGFNMSGRYDNVKFNFYKICTKEYTEKYFNISKELYLWLKEKYRQK